MLMTLGGARNETSSELIRSIFRSGKENSLSLHESVRSLIRSINVKEDENNRIVVANKMILNSVGVHDQFRELISNVYESSVDTVRSESSVNQLAEETNRWISELTEGRIKSIVDEETLKETSIALINAVYFKMQWLIGFKDTETRDEEFRVSAQKTKELPMMRLTRTKLPYFYSDLLKSHLLSLPYKGGRHSFNIVFPDDETDFLVFDDEKSLIRTLKYESLVGEMNKLSEQKVNVRIPKFTQEKKIKVYIIS
jgi:serine protease inhibitor